MEKVSGKPGTLLPWLLAGDFTRLRTWLTSSKLSIIKQVLI